MNFKKFIFSLFTFLTFLTPKLQGQNLHTDWAIQVGGNNTAEATAVTTRDGYIYIVGNFIDTVDLDPGPGILQDVSTGNIRSMYVQKLDSAGNLVWAKTFGGESYTSIIGNDIHIDEFDDIYITGELVGTIDFSTNENPYFLTSNGSRDAFILKLNNSGNFLWAHNYGGLQEDNSFNIRTDDSANVYIAGYFSGTTDFDFGDSIYNVINEEHADLFVLKLKREGDFIWVKTVNGNGANGNSTGFVYGYSMDINSEGDILITGNYTNSVDFDPDTTSYILTINNSNSINFGACNVFILKLDTDGDFVWAKSIQDQSFISFSTGKSIKIDNNDNILISGLFTNTFDFDPGIDTFSMTSFGPSNKFLLKLNSQGDFLWAKSWEFYPFSGFEFTLDQMNNIYFTGGIEYTKDLDPNESEFILTPTGGRDIYLLKLDENGNFNSLNTMDGIGYEYPNDITIDYLGNIITVGSFEQSVDFDPSLDTLNLTASGLTNAFVVKLSQCYSNASVNTHISHLSATIPNALYQWLDCNDGFTKIPGENMQDFYPLTNGYYAVEVTVDDCSSISACLPFNWLGNEENILDSKISIFPNPTSDYVQLRFNFIYPTDIRLTDNQGKVVILKNINDTVTDLTIDTRHLHSGMYFIEIRKGNELIETKKLIIF